MSENRIGVTRAELRFWSNLASGSTYSPEAVGAMRTALSRAVSELVRLNACVPETAASISDADRILADLSRRLGLSPAELIEHHRGPDPRSIRIAVAAEVLRRRGMKRNAIAGVMRWSRAGVDRALRLVAQRMKEPGFRLYVERVCNDNANQ